jgi:hypothetical protein
MVRTVLQCAEIYILLDVCMTATAILKWRLKWRLKTWRRAEDVLSTGACAAAGLPIS